MRVVEEEEEEEEGEEGGDKIVTRPSPVSEQRRFNKVKGSLLIT